MEVMNLSEAISPLPASPPVTIQLCDRVVGAKMVANKPPFTTPTPNRMGKRPKKVGVVGFEAGLHEADSIWPDEGSLSKLDVRNLAKDCSHSAR